MWVVNYLISCDTTLHDLEVLRTSRVTYLAASCERVRAQIMAAHAELDAAQTASLATIYRKVIMVQQRVWGPDHPTTVSLTQTVARALHNRGQGAEARRILREALMVRQRLLGPDHPTPPPTPNPQ
jgi:hypothetical protein